MSGHVLDVSGLEELPHVLLLELVILGFEPPVKPIRVRDARNRIHTLLKSRRNSHDLHDGSSQPLLVVIPVKDIFQAEVHHVGTFVTPFA